MVFVEFTKPKYSAEVAGKIAFGRLYRGWFDRLTSRKLQIISPGFCFSLFLTRLVLLGSFNGWAFVVEGMTTNKHAGGGTHPSHKLWHSKTSIE